MDVLNLREKAFSRKHIVGQEIWTRELPPLNQGQHVLVQNQRGPHSNKWELSGTIIEALPNDTYLVKMDGCGRVTRRRRNFIKAVKFFDPSNEEALQNCSVENTFGGVNRRWSERISNNLKGGT